nr:putative pumilio homolog 8, chloroplastic [Coffea arabica]
MEERNQEDLEWLMARNPPPQSSPNAFGILPIPENPRTFSLPSPGNHVNRLSSLPASRSLHIPNPYHTNVALHNSANTNIHVNPNYADSFYDYLLEAEFNQLNLSTPRQTTAAAAAAAYGCHVGRLGSVPGKFGSIPVGSNTYVDDGSVGTAQFPLSYTTTRYANNGNFQRMRIDSAVRGQLGMYIQPQYLTSVDDQVLNGNLRGSNQVLNGNAFHDQEMDNLPRQGLVSVNRSASAFRPELGFVFPNNSGRNKINTTATLQRRERSLDGFDYDNPSLSTSFHSRCRQRGQNLSSLEELRSKIFSSLEDLRGKIFIVAKDQNGARDLQKMLAEGKPKEKEIIFSELKDHVRELMVDQFANYLAQKMFEIGNAEQITELLLLVINDEHSLMAICLDMHGTRAMQKLLGHVTTPEQRSLVISALRRITVTLTKSNNGHHVVEHCLKYFPIEDKKYILDVVADNCLDIATDKSGCCVLQQCVEHARGEPRDRLIAEITANALVLSEHPYGNYVVQFIIGLQIPYITSDILSQLAGNYVSLSMNKYGSNVVEKCMKESSEEQAMQIIKEIIGSQNFLTVLQDPFGNYVAQSAFAIAKGSIRHAMINLIQMHYSYLHSHPHGKRVLARARGSKQRM